VLVRDSINVKFVLRTLVLVNVGLFAGASYVLYTEPHLRRDRRTLSATLACTLALIGMESYAADTYLQTPEGQEAQRKAKKEGSLVYRQAREHILRPGVLGGLVGIGKRDRFVFAAWADLI
jgi:hypothetical protein